MSFRQDAARLRRELLKRPGLYPAPRCPLCGNQCAPRDYAPHTRQCERDCASKSILALDRALATLWATEGRDEGLMEQLERERFNWHTVLFGFDEQGRGRVVTDAPGWPDDGMPF